MALFVPSYPQVQLSASVCSQLRAHGLLVTPSSPLWRHLLFNGPVELGTGSYICRTKIDAYTILEDSARISTATIGRYCTICHEAEMGIGVHDSTTLSSSPAFQYTANFIITHDPLKRLSRQHHKNREDSNQVTMGHDVYVGPQACIIGDVTIGTGAIIEAGSIITRDVPPYAIVSGAGGGKNSKNIIKGYRFTDEVISDLLESKWWEYDLPKLMSSSASAPSAGATGATGSGAICPPLNQAEDFLAFMRESDTSLWPRIEDKWIYMVAISSTEVKLVPCPPDQLMTPQFPVEYFPDSEWA